MVVGMGAQAVTDVAPVYVGAPDYPHSVERRRFTGIPSIARASNGRYWATWFASAGNTEDVNTYVVLATSADGDSWTWVFPNDWEPFGCETFPELRKFTGCGVYALTTDGA